MCGILGGNIKKWDYETGIKAIRHRGPDAQKVISYADCTLAFARLSIMDLSMAAMQPMENDSGDVSIIYNGEIYGYSSLRRQLERKYEFRTTSDTEVILHAYEEYGDKFIDMVDGMYAIAIYDHREGLIKIYRDRYGIKPLYYYIDGDRFAFASELKALVAAGGDMNWELENTALYDFLCYQYVPEPKTMYKKVFKLKPAHRLVYDLKEKKIRSDTRYWKLNVNTNAHGKRNKRDTADDIRQLIKKSVSDQMIADVPVGTFLSGGVDSSIVTYESSRIHNDIMAFSIGFKEKSHDESAYASLMVDKYGINQKLKVLCAEDVRKLSGTMRSIYDEPFADPSEYPTVLISKLAREHVTVVLTGDGSDEIFGGYDRYAYFASHEGQLHHDSVMLEKMMKRILMFVGERPDTWRKYVQSKFDFCCKCIGIFDDRIYSHWRDVLKLGDDYDPRWYLSKYYIKDLPVMTRFRYLDFKTYLPSDILVKVDRASMSTSLEARVPFLNRELIEYVFGLAEDECSTADQLKAILKEAYRGIIPDEILFRKKAGFGIPDYYLARNASSRSTYETILYREWGELVREFKRISSE